MSLFREFKIKKRRENNKSPRTASSVEAFLNIPSYPSLDKGDCTQGPFPNRPSVWVDSYAERRSSRHPDSKPFMCRPGPWLRACMITILLTHKYCHCCLKAFALWCGQDWNLNYISKLCQIYSSKKKCLLKRPGWQSFCLMSKLLFVCVHACVHRCMCACKCAGGGEFAANPGGNPVHTYLCVSPVE